MLGNPKYKREQMISFTLDCNGEIIKHDGVIYVVDPNGCDEQSTEPTYDIEVFLNGEVVLFKHVPESSVSERE